MAICGQIQISIVIMFLGLVLSGQGGHAQTSDQSSSAARFSERLEIPHVGSHWFGEVRAESMQYLSVLPENPSLTRSQYLSGFLMGHGAWNQAESFQWHVDVSGGTFFSFSQSHLVVRELYMESRQYDGTQIYTLGRRKMPWSELDSHWNLALFQPSYASDLLRPEEQGLAGGFFEYSTHAFSFVAFASPLYIPSMGPEIREESDSLVSDSRWYRAPSKSLNFNGRSNTIYYKLDIPEISRLTSQSSGAMQFRVGNRQNGGWVQSAFADKPVNELLLTREATKSASTDRADVKVSPAVATHRVVSADAGYTVGRWMASLSYLEDQPRFVSARADWVIQKLAPIKAYSASLDGQIDAGRFRNIALRMSYLKLVGGAIEDVDSAGDADDMTLFDRRTRFSDAISLGVKGVFARLLQRPLGLSFDYTYDKDQKGSLVRTELEWYGPSSWNVILGADFLGVDDESYNPSSFLNQYRANDRVYGGMSYVF